MQWRAGVGNFYRYTYPLIKMKRSLSFNFHFKMVLKNFFYFLFYEKLLLLHGDIETNPGPDKKYKPFTCCHWNVNSLSAHNLLKLSSITAYNTIYKYDFICISETYLDSSVQSDNRDISINGYKLIRADHPSNSKRGGVCIFYRESLAVQSIKINYLTECLLCKFSFNNKKSYIAVLYRSPSQNSLEFDNFILSFEKLLCEINSFKPDFSIILGDFNARSNSWWIGDIETSEGSRINALTTSYGFQQLISEPTHTLNNSSSCIDLIFTDQTNLVINSGTHPSLHPNCHHKITHCKIDLKITYLPPYKRLVWDFKRANIPSIRKAIKMVDWRFMFLNKSIHDQVSIFNNTLINIFSNYIPHKYVTVEIPHG